MVEIKGKNVEDVWKKVLKQVYEKGEDFVDKDGRTCRELLNVSLNIENPEKITKPIEMLNSFGKWIYPPLEELETFILIKKDVPGYYYNYGSRAFNFNGINQIDKFVIPLLKKDKTSRRASVIFYNPIKDSFTFKKDIPGMIMANFNVRDGKLHVTTLIRSNDLFFGWPANIYQIYTLQKYISKKLDCELGSLTTTSISAHIFEDHFEDIKKVFG